MASEDSPFSAVPRQFEKEKSPIEKASNFLRDKMSEMFVKAIPSDTIRDMPPKYLYFNGVLLILILIGIFLALFCSAYFKGLEQEFLSPLSGTTADNFCETISTSNTGNFLATQSGNWQGGENFQYSEAAYLASLTSFTVSESSYANVMDSLYVDLSNIGNISAENDLGVNLILWTSFTALPDPSNSAQRFSLVGDPLVIFNRQYVIGAISSVAGICNLTSVGGYDEGRGYVSVGFNAESYMGNPTCMAATNPYMLAYIPGVNNGLFNIYFDVRTLMTGIAMNFNIISFSQIVEITGQQATFNYKGQIYNTSNYYDPSFPGMQPLTCITGFPTPVCALRLGSIFALPMFMHKGNSTILPERCNCSYMSAQEKNEAYSECNLFSLLAGFIFYDTFSPDLIFELYLKYNSSAYNINYLAFDAAYAASYWGRHSPYAANFTTSAAREQMYEFCRIGNTSCSIVTFSVFDQNWRWAISSYYFQLMYGACQDNISPTYNNWQKLIASPFAPLLQEYQKCYNPPTSVFLTEFGVSLSNIGAITPFCVLFFLGCIYLYQKLTGDVIPQAYNKNERDEVLNAFAISLLLGRDRQRIRRVSTYHTDHDAFLRQDSTVSNETINALIRDLENDAEYHSNTYKLDGKIQQFKIDWSQLANRMNIISPLMRGSSLRNMSEKSIKSSIDNQTVDLENVASPVSPDPFIPKNDSLAHPNTQKFELKALPQKFKNKDRKEVVEILNKEENFKLSHPSHIYPALLRTHNKKKVLDKLDELYDRVSEIIQKNTLYHQGGTRSVDNESFISEYENYFYQICFLNNLDRKLVKITVNAGRNSIDSDDEFEDMNSISPRASFDRRKSWDESDDKTANNSNNNNNNSKQSSNNDAVTDEFFVHVFFEKVYHLLILHCSVVKNCMYHEEAMVRELYGDKVGYQIAHQLFTMNDLHENVVLDK
jgi:hypothetical protein